MHPDPHNPIADATPLGDPVPLETDEDDIDESEYDDDPDGDSDDGGLDDEDDDEDLEDLEDDIDSRLSSLRPPFPITGTVEAAEFGRAVGTCPCDRCQTLRRDEVARDRWLSRVNCPEIMP